MNWRKTDGKNLETQTVRTFSPGDLKAVRSGLSERQIVDRLGAGLSAAWQFAPIFENVSRRQTIASVQQAAGRLRERQPLVRGDGRR